MSFSELRLFKEIAVTGSMSKGAKVCGVTQSAASQHVQEMERRLGSPLLDRSKRPLELTPAGKLYADFCRDVMRQEELRGNCTHPQRTIAISRIKKGTKI